MRSDTDHIFKSDVVSLDDTITIEDALKKGGRLHTFRSGGGLRVVRVEDKNGKLLGYGEHPNIEEALVYLAEDLKAGGRSYDTVYGPIHEHYLTGSLSPSSRLDAWILRGNNFDAVWVDERIEVVLASFEFVTMRKVVQKGRAPVLGTAIAEAFAATPVAAVT